MPQSEPGRIDWSSPETIDGVARTVRRAHANGEGNVVLAGIVLPGVLERVVELDRTEGEQLCLNSRS